MAIETHDLHPDPPRADALGTAACLGRLAAGDDAGAWAWLLLDLGEPMRAAAYRLTGDASLADDAVQEALLAIRRCAGEFHPQHSHGDPPDDQAKRWILRVVANAARMVRRSEARAQRRGRAGALADVPAAQGARLERGEAASLVRDALDALPERERAAVLLHVVAELGFEQVARELRCPLGTAKTWVRRGLNRLRRHLRRTPDSVPAIASLLSAPSAHAPPLALRAAAAGAKSAGTASLLPAAVHGASMATLIAIPATLALALGGGFALRTLAADAPVPTIAAAATRASAPSARAPDPAAPAPEAPALRPDQLDRLDQRIHVDFNGSSLGDVAPFLQQVTALSCTVDPACASAAITLAAKDATLRTTVEVIAAESGAALTFARGLHFQPADAPTLDAALARNMELHLHHAGWGRVLDILRCNGLPVIDAAPLDAEGWTVSIDVSGDGAAALDAVSVATGLTWTKARGWVVLGSAALGRIPRQDARAIRDALEQEITVEFTATDLGDAMSFIQKVTGLNALVDHRLAPMPAVTLKVQHWRLRRVLAAIASQCGLRLARRGSVLVIAGCPSALLPVRAPSGLDPELAPASAPASTAPHAAASEAGEPGSARPEDRSF
jgi:RNA polymerase sigma-70 factor (ECF subfamily)